MCYTSINERGKGQPGPLKSEQKGISHEVLREFDPCDFEFWGGAKDRMDSATDEQRKEVYDQIEILCYEQECSMTDINDFVWFECDEIFQ